MPEIRKIKIRSKKRVETGAIQFNEDWPGIFMRGDQCGYFSMQLKSIKKSIEKGEQVGLLEKSTLDTLIGLFSESRI